MDTVEASSQPLSYPWPCRFYSSLIQQLLSSMAIVKETAHHQCTAAVLFSLLLFPSLSPMWHKGLSYTPPLLSLCQEPSSVRLLLYCMREIHLALCTRWSVKRESPFILRRGAECTGDCVCGIFFFFFFFPSKCQISTRVDQWWAFRRNDIPLITHVGLNSPAGKSCSCSVDRSLVIWCFFANQRNLPCPSSGTFFLNLLPESPSRYGKSALLNVKPSLRLQLFQESPKLSAQRRAMMSRYWGNITHAIILCPQEVYQHSTGLCLNAVT